MHCQMVQPACNTDCLTSVYGVGWLRTCVHDHDTSATADEKPSIGNTSGWGLLQPATHTALKKLLGTCTANAVKTRLHNGVHTCWLLNPQVHRLYAAALSVTGTCGLCEHTALTCGPCVHISGCNKTILFAAHLRC
jgi:hypothetical protein